MAWHFLLVKRGSGTCACVQVPLGRSGSLAEGEIDALTLLFICLFDPVEPVLLGLPSHHEKRTMLQLEIDAFAGAVLALQRKDATVAEADRGDGRLGAELWLVIAVKADRIPAVAVEIEKDRVVGGAGNLLHAIAQGEKRWGPGVERKLVRNRRRQRRRATRRAAAGGSRDRECGPSVVPRECRGAGCASVGEVARQDQDVGGK